MSEDPYLDSKIPPTSQENSQPEQEHDANEGGLWANLGRMGIGNNILRLGTHVITIALVGVVIVGLANFFTAEQINREESLRATAEVIAAPTIEASIEALVGTGGAQGLPDFTMPNTEFTVGIPRFAKIDTTIPNRPRVGISTYEVKQGDNVFSIADKFGLRPETILWGNFTLLQDDPRIIKTGQELNILPVDGVYYQWNEGENLSNVAEFFEVETATIIEWPGNNLDPYQTDQEDPGISDGTWLIIPGGTRDLVDWGPPPISRDNPAVAAYYGPGSCGSLYEGAIGNGTFVWPTSASIITTYYSAIHPATDIAGPEGSAIYATDGGVVVYAGWSNYGYGFMIVIDHGTGWQSAYAHLSGVGVFCGQSISQGTLIGGMGSTGNSSGSHLHFELLSTIYGKVDPLNFVSP